MRVGGGGHHSLKLTRHVWMGQRRRTSVYYGSTALLLLETTTSSTARCRWSSDFHKPAAHHRSTLVLTSQTSKDGSSGGSSGGKDPGDRKTVTTTTSTPGTTPSVTPSSSGGRDNHHWRDVPRRILVKQSGSSAAEMNAPGKGADSSSSSYNTKHLKQQQHVGYLKRRFPLHNEST